MAIAYAIVVHALQAAIVFVVGLIVLHRSGEGFAQFLKKSEEPNEIGDPLSEESDLREKAVSAS